MAFDIGELVTGKLTASLTLKKKVNIQLFKMFLFCIYRMRIDKKGGRHIVILACPFGYKMWWI